MCPIRRLGGVRHRIVKSKMGVFARSSRPRKGDEMTAPQWFERWFGDEYKRLYPHRDSAQAVSQTRDLLESVREAASAFTYHRILDIGCGAGRHLDALRALVPSNPHSAPCLVTGIDLSPVLLRDARSSAHAVTRADMRRLPFADAGFDLVASFFTSFGYFASAAEDEAALQEFVRVTKVGGFLFLDLPNKTVVQNALVPADTVNLQGRTVSVTRKMEGDVVVKRILIERDDGVSEQHEERVRLYDLPAMEPVCARVGLHLVKVTGDEHGAAFDASSSPRMSLLMRRLAPAGERRVP
jgi:SAM-dependent methyltransferase